MKNILKIVIEVLLIIKSIEMYSQTMTLDEFLPNVPTQWQLEDSARLYTPETLYDYIDGGAELYISYNFKSVISTRYNHPLYGEIRLEIFDMVEPRNAFGVFSQTRTREENEFGDGSQYFTGAQIFWKNKYFVTIMADDENDTLRTIIKSLAKQVDNKIKQYAQKPSIVSKLPIEGLVPDGYLYFHHYIWLNAYYFISTDNILNITDQTNAVLAKYGEASHRQYLLMVEYQTPQLAKEATSLFVSKYIGNSPGSTTYKIEDGTWSGYVQSNKYFIAVFNASSMENATQLLKNAQKNIE